MIRSPVGAQRVCQVPRRQSTMVYILVVLLCAAVAASICQQGIQGIKSSVENHEICSFQPFPIQIHVEEYPRNIQDRHKANVDEFSRSVNLHKISRFYVKLDFLKRTVSDYLHCESSREFLKLIGGEDRSNLNFTQLLAYLKLEDGNRYSINRNNTSIVWMTFTTETRFALLDGMTGSFEWSFLFQQIDNAKSRGIRFRQIQTTEVHFEGFHHIFVRMHFSS
jgi:hypothetical protein